MRLKPTILFILLIGMVCQVKADKLDKLRSSKKIIRMETAQPPYFAIQIIALRLPPQAPQFFKNVDVAREYACMDGYLRFCVGEYQTYEEAKLALPDVKDMGYDQAFVVNTSTYQLSYNEMAPSVSGSEEIDPNKIYTVQLSAYRFPVYLSHFENIDHVMEFRLKDKVFRYTTGEYLGTVAEEELQRIKALGYKDAVLVELAKYLPYKIE